MPTHLAYTTLIVPGHDAAYDEAIAHYAVLGFQVVEDTVLSPSKRWVVIQQPGGRGNALLLAKAGNAEQAAMVGRQGAGRVWLFLHTADLDADLALLARSPGYRLTESPRTEAYGRVLVFVDRYGNRWDLVEPLKTA